MITEIPQTVQANEVLSPPTFTQRFAALWRAKFFSPKDFVRRAFVLTLLFALAHVLGLKEFTSVLTSTTGSVALGWTTSALLGLTYVLLYLGFVLLVPIFLLTAAILFVWSKVSNSERSARL
jgi:hypothetical protein